MASTNIEAQAQTGDTGAQVELAALLDREGRHTDAINWLSRAAKTGDAKALTQLGLRMLTGRDVPFLPTEGVQMLADAAARGGGDAAGHLAVLIGLGFYAKQSWPAALDCLQRSAELGSASSQAQLRILAGRSDEFEPSVPDGWRQLRQAIDLGAWFAPLPNRPVSEDPLVVAFDSLFPPAACDWVIQQSQDKLVRAEIYGAVHGGGQTDRSRTNTTANFTLEETNLLNVLLQGKLAQAAGAPLTHLEAINVLHYSVGEQFVDHVDYLDPSNPVYAHEIEQRGQRAASFLVYLNDGYEGGSTDFPRLGVSHRGGKGGGLLFANVGADGGPDPRTLHAGRATTVGEKWLLTQFIRSRPQFGASGARA